MAQTLFGIKERIRNTGMKMASVLHALIINFLFTMSNHYTEKETLFLYVTSHGVNIKRQLQNKKYRGLIIIMMMMMMMIIMMIIIIIIIIIIISIILDNKVRPCEKIKQSDIYVSLTHTHTHTHTIH